jgi:hypothetical protein
MSLTNRALRVGVILGGNLVEERLFRLSSQTPITIGQSLRCTLSVPADGVPLEHVLFGIDQGRFVLRITDHMTGRVGTGEIGELRGNLPIERGTRGKLQLGDATILFQEVAAPPIVARPQLPASVRGTLADRVDRRLALIVAGSVMLHLGIAGWAWMQDIAKDRPVDHEVAAYDPPQYDILDITAPDIIAPSDNGTPGVATPAHPAVQTPGTSIKRPTDLPDPGDVDRWAQVLTGNLPGKDGQNEIGNRLPASDLDRQIRHITDNDQNIRPGSSNRTTRDGDPRIGNGPNGPQIGDPTLDQIAKQEGDPKVRITPIPQPPGDPKPTLTINMVLARIQNQYMAGLQRCYVKHGLSIDSTMVAKVTVSFVVDDKGVSTENSAHGANAEVDRCIADQMGGWRFPVPKDADGDPTDAPFKLKLALQPN